MTYSIRAALLAGALLVTGQAAFAVLFGSIHVTPWSHELAGTHEHSHEAAHDDHEDANADVGLGDEQPANNADVGDIGHHHSMPTGIENAGNDFDTSGITRQSVAFNAQATIPASHSRAPPTQPPPA